MLNVTPRHQHLKLLFSFMLGVALTAILFSGSLLQSSRCSGKLCNSTPAPFKKLLPVSALPEATAIWRNARSPADGRSSDSSTSPSAHSSISMISSSTYSSTSPSAHSSISSSTYSSTSPSVHSSITSSTSPTLQSISTKHRQTTVASNLKLKLSKPVGMTATYPPFTFPTQKSVQRTFPVPSTMTNVSMEGRSSRRACKTGCCSEHLSPTEKVHFYDCYTKCQEKERKFGPVVNGTCHFMNGQGRLPVALASFPGSGNTWTRGLLEKVTGVCTGALYCDCGLRVSGFAGEGIQGPSVLVTKTHNLKVQFVGGHMFTKDRIPYGAAVMLVRDPRAALVAEWNRERSKRMVSHNVSNHFTYVEQEYFGENKDWDAYIHTKLPRWPVQIVNLLTEAKLSQRPVYVLQFEDLKSDTARELKKVTDFLGFSYSLEEVSTRLQAGFTKFYRNHTAQFSHFTAGQEKYIHDVVYHTSQVMRENGLHGLFPRIDDYL